MTDIVIVGEAWGAEEEQQQLPFVGPSGRLLRGLLHSAGIAFHAAPRKRSERKNGSLRCLSG